MARTVRPAVLAAAMLCIVAGGAPALAAGPEPVACADETEALTNKAAEPSAAADAFAAYCRRCHEAGPLARDYFRGAGPEREAELARFLDRHSACPHRHHEEIAAWLRQLQAN